MKSDVCCKEKFGLHKGFTFTFAHLSFKVCVLNGEKEEPEKNHDSLPNYDYFTEAKSIPWRRRNSRG